MARLCSANDKAGSSRAVPIETVMFESLKRIEKSETAGAIIPTGFTELDKQIGGLEKDDLLVVAGRPSMGKTSLALDLGLNAAQRGFFVLIVSVETSREKLGIRMLSRETKINSRRFRTGALEDRDLPRLIAASGKLSKLPIHVLDRETAWSNIKREIRRRKRDGLDMVILDYLTLLDLAAGKNERRDLAWDAWQMKQSSSRCRSTLHLFCYRNSTVKAKTATTPSPSCRIYETAATLSRQPT